MPRLLQILSLGIIAACSTACSSYESRLPETGATLEGAVTYGGEAVPMALIIVMGQKASRTGPIENGRYKVENAPLGDVKIGVNTEAARGQMISQQMAQGYKGPGVKGGAKAPPPKFVEVPSKYWEAESSGIKTTVKRGKNSFDIGLTK